MSDSSPHPVLYTLGDLWRLSESQSTCELSAGELLIAEPPPCWQHGSITANMVWQLMRYLQSNDLGRVVTCDTWFVLQRAPDTVRGPDVAFVRHERCATLVDPKAAFEGAPDLVVEVLSPSDTTARIQRKIDDYERACVPTIWLIDPDSRSAITIEGGKRQRVSEEEYLQCHGLLPGFKVRLSDLFL